MLGQGWRNRDLIFSLIRRDIASKYRGSVLGMVWALLNPLLMLAIYTFVFSQVFKMRWGGASNPSEFALMLFAGMLVFSFFSETVTRAPGLITGTPNLVKKIVFPLDIQGYVVIGSALFQSAISLIVLIGAHIIMKGLPPATALLIPVVFAPLSLMCLGLVWILSALGVYLRDIGQIVGHLVMMTMFLSPLFYPESAVPERFRFFIDINPLAMLIAQSRRVLILGDWPQWNILGWFTLAAFAFASFGYWLFQRTRKGFADVL
ncbi:transport permease protein [Dyella sp. GSA-30]|nr:transport permease protein [Dyella sp. GSA-30]